MSTVSRAGSINFPIQSIELTDEIGVIPYLLHSVGRMRLPTESIGNTVVTFAGVNAGSEIRVYLPGQIEAAGVESCDADHELTWPVFAAGSPNNTVRVVILADAYRIKEFSYAATVGAQTLPVQQEPDKWFSNP